MCLAAFLFYASFYLLLPLLPALVEGQISLVPSQTAMLFVACGGALLAVGPFHAYLGDTYKRKYVLMTGITAVALSLAGILYAEEYVQWLCLMALLGAGIGIASAAGITVAIDITASSRRSSGNEAFAWAGRLGMLAGVLLGVVLHPLLSLNQLVYLAVGLDVCALLVVSQVYVAFRAPIGLPLLSFDRFFLPRAWLPFFNLWLLAFATGILLPLLDEGHCWWALIPLLVLTLCATLFTKLFVGLSQHCQRSTANTTCHLALDLGVLVGLVFFSLHSSSGDSLFVAEVGGISMAAALLCYLLATHPYYKKKRLR